MNLDITAWRSLELDERITEGNRNEVWRGSIDGVAVSVRRSRRSEPSLEWELDLIDHLHVTGFRVPAVIESDDGRRQVNGVVVQRWLDGRAPESERDWRLVAATLQRLHASTDGYRQRPGCCAVGELTRSSRSVDADMAQLPDDVAGDVLSVFADVAGMSLAVIHGDPMAGNIRISDDDDVGLLDFDESRVDVAWHDLSNLGVQILDDNSHARALRLSDAWEAANGWVAEPEYAQARLRALRATTYDFSMDDDAARGRVTGIGGVFFRSPDPASTRKWYAEHLGLGMDEYGSNFRWRSYADPDRTGFTQWSPFADDTDYFGDRDQEAMINYRVDDLDAVLVRLQDAGVELVGEMQVEPFGRFQHILDGDGRRVELWQPVDAEYEEIVDGTTDT